MKLTQYHPIMKTRIFLLTLVLCFACNGANVFAGPNNGLGNDDASGQNEGSLTSLATALQQQYQIFDAKADAPELLLTADRQVAADQHLLLLTDGLSQESLQTATDWRMPVGRDIFVPIIHAKNPLATQLASSGINAETLAKICRVETLYDANGNPAQLHFYCSDQDAAMSVLTSFLGIHPQDISASVVTQELFAKLESDPMSLGFVKLSLVAGALEQNPQMDIRFVPIDRNSNGKVDHTENFYGSVYDIERAAWLGKFPRQLTNPYFLTTQGQPSEAQMAFVLYAQQQGQQVIQQAGVGTLPPVELKSNVGKLLKNPPIVLNPGLPFDWNKILFPLAGLGFILLLLGSIYLRRTSAPATHAPSAIITDRMFEDAKLEAPAGLLYDRSHTWTLMQREGLVKIGVDDFLLHITGAFSKIKPKAIGQQIRKGEQIVSLMQNGKELVLYAPVSGVIKSVNTKLLHDASAMSQSPNHEGWIYEIEPTNWAMENSLMMMVDAYRVWIGAEFVRLRDFFAGNQQNISSLQPVMQDGGEMKLAVLRDCGPEVWENFQANFIDPSR